MTDSNQVMELGESPKVPSHHDSSQDAAANIPGIQPSINPSGAALPAYFEDAQHAQLPQSDPDSHSDSEVANTHEVFRGISPELIVQSLQAIRAGQPSPTRSGSSWSSFSSLEYDYIPAFRLSENSSAVESVHEAEASYRYPYVENDENIIDLPSNYSVNNEWSDESQSEIGPYESASQTGGPAGWRDFRNDQDSEDAARSEPRGKRQSNKRKAYFSRSSQSSGLGSPRAFLELRQSDVSSDTTPPICKPLPNGEYRNPFTSTREETSAMFAGWFGADSIASYTGRSSAQLRSSERQLPPNRSLRKQSSSAWLSVTSRPSSRSRGRSFSRQRSPNNKARLPATYVDRKMPGWAPPASWSYNDSTNHIYDLSNRIHGFSSSNLHRDTEPFQLASENVDSGYPQGLSVPQVEESDATTPFDLITVLPLQTIPQKGNESSKHALAHVWRHGRVNLDEGGLAELTTISSLEHYVNASGESITSISKIPFQGPGDYSGNNTLRWLNVQKSRPTPDILQVTI
ncbi:hypothetical protein F5Y15DRAFT_396313 [Xylariaceae sp. FL0016]|nr:hypothetical protein F5Y15DRAFT_396313 [Xylariaceae sp. FL0016]